MDNVIKAIEKEHMRTDLPKVSVGDTVRVLVKVVEGTRERIQTFEGYVIAIKNGGIREMITVRRVSFGVGIERTFPIHSPKIAGIEIVRRNKTRRSKLYFLRERAGKAAKLKEKR
ncbi:MAG: 50S ribosomal protein L19 [Burkholderiales bacterium]